jgi:hypothetical protein
MSQFPADPLVAQFTKVTREFVTAVRQALGRDALMQATSPPKQEPGIARDADASVP